MFFRVIADWEIGDNRKVSSVSNGLSFEAAEAVALAQAANGAKSVSIVPRPETTGDVAEIIRNLQTDLTTLVEYSRDGNHELAQTRDVLAAALEKLA